jgi:GH24 family phage-related lysozyme (muramidase)/peptidoglycan hydrolase-like protein with peptidoglycan-binding domain
VPRIYTDHKGIPTIGVGTALAVKDAKGKFQLRKDLDQRMSLATHHQYRLTPSERRRLQDAVKAINAGNLSVAKKLIPQFNDNEETIAQLRKKNNKFGFTIDPVGMQAVAHQDMASARAAAWRDVAGAAQAAGWSRQEIDDYRKKFIDSQEMIALASIKYNAGNNVKLPKINKYIIDGNRAGVVYEIEIRTNGGKVAGIAVRRQEEAKFFANSMTQEDKAALVQLIRANPAEYDAYAIKFPASIKNSASYRALESAVEAEGLEIIGAQNDQAVLETAQQQAVKTALLQQDGPLDDIVAKRPAAWSEADFRAMKREIFGLLPGRERGWLDGMVHDFLAAQYGDAPMELDATGRMIAPPRLGKNALDEPATAPGGGPLQAEISRVAVMVASAAGRDSATRALQTGLNMLDADRDEIAYIDEKAQETPTGERRVNPAPLKTGGVVGPKTRRSLRVATGRRGAEKVAEGLALGRFAKFVEDAPSGGENADVESGNLRAAIHDAFGPLFDAEPDSSVGEAEEAAFQATVNDWGATGAVRKPSRQRAKPIREDGRIGPRTQTAFRALNTNAAPAANAFAVRLGRNLGLLTF